MAVHRLLMALVTCGLTTQERDQFCTTSCQQSHQFILSDFGSTQIIYLLNYSIDIRAAADTSLSQPTSKTTGRHCCGGTPPIAVYSDNFPMGIPMPNAPRSPNPRILSPSVMTTAYNCPYIKSQYNTNSISSAPTTSTADRGRIT